MTKVRVFISNMAVEIEVKKPEEIEMIDREFKYWEWV